jgi:hypothetical protein
MIPESGSLWRCNQCHYGVYQVANVEESVVYYRIYDDNKNRLMTMNLGLWLITHEPLPIDDVLVETGGIF